MDPSELDALMAEVRKNLKEGVVILDPDLQEGLETLSEQRAEEVRLTTGEHIAQAVAGYDSQMAKVDRLRSIGCSEDKIKRCEQLAKASLRRKLEFHWLAYIKILDLLKKYS